MDALSEARSIVLKNRQLGFHEKGFSLAGFIIGVLKKYPSEKERDEFFQSLVTLENRSLAVLAQVTAQRRQELDELLLKPKSLTATVAALQKQVQQCRSFIKSSKNHVLNNRSLAGLQERAKEEKAIMECLPAVGSYSQTALATSTHFQEVSQFLARLPDYLADTPLRASLCNYLERVKVDMVKCFKRQLDDIIVLRDLPEVKAVIFHPNKAKLFHYLDFLWAKAPCPLPELLNCINGSGSAPLLLKHIELRQDHHLRALLDQTQALVLHPDFICPKVGSFLVRNGATNSKQHRKAFDFICLLMAGIHIYARRVTAVLRKLNAGQLPSQVALLQKAKAMCSEQLLNLVKSRSKLLVYPKAERVVAQSLRILKACLGVEQFDEEDSFVELQFDRSFADQVAQYSDELFRRDQFFDYTVRLEKDLLAAVEKGFPPESREQRAKMFQAPHFGGCNKQYQGVFQFMVLVEQLRQIRNESRKKRSLLIIANFLTCLVVLKARLFDIVGAVQLDVKSVKQLMPQQFNLQPLRTKRVQDYIAGVAARNQKQISKPGTSKLEQLAAMERSVSSLIRCLLSLVELAGESGPPNLEVVQTVEKLSRNLKAKPSLRGMVRLVTEECKDSYSELQTASAAFVQLALLLCEVKQKAMELSCRKTACLRN